jgi:hypothetical protein
VKKRLDTFNMVFNPQCTNMHQGNPEINPEATWACTEHTPMEIVRTYTGKLQYASDLDLIASDPKQIPNESQFKDEEGLPVSVETAKSLAELLAGSCH